MLTTLTLFLFEHESSWLKKVLLNKEYLAQIEEKYGILLLLTDDIREASVIWTHTFGKVVKDMLNLKSNIQICGNGLHNTDVLENKFSCSCIENNMDSSLVIETYYIEFEELNDFCTNFFSENDNIFFLKDSGANAAEDLYIISKKNYKDVLKIICQLKLAKRKFVLQKYVKDIDLYDKCFKYNLRIYIVLKSNGSSFLYNRGFKHIANRSFTFDDINGAYYDKQVHLTNVSANFVDSSAFKGCPDFELSSEPYFEKLQLLLQKYIHSSYYFMRRQCNEDSFSFIGADVIITSTLEPKIIEFNIPPGVDFYGKVMSSRMTQVLNSLFHNILVKFLCKKNDLNESKSWIQLTSKSTHFSKCKVLALYRNSFEFAIYTRKFKSSKAIQKIS